MKILKVILTVLAVIIAVVLIAGVIAVPALRKSGLPDLNGRGSCRPHGRSKGYTR